jgi:hypothetical protein
MTNKRYEYYLLTHHRYTRGVSIENTVRTANGIILFRTLAYITTHKITSDHMETIYWRNWVAVRIR